MTHTPPLGQPRTIPTILLEHYDAPAIRWTIGAHTVLSLRRVTPASWEEIHDLAAHIEPAPVREVTAA